MRVINSSIQLFSALGHVTNFSFSQSNLQLLDANVHQLRNLRVTVNAR